MTEPSEPANGKWHYRAGITVAVITSLLTVWTTIVRDDGNGIGFLLVVLTAGMGAFAAWFRPAGMARAMGGVAVMQLLLGAAIATATSTEQMPGASLKVLIFNAVFAALWLTAAAFFFAAANREIRSSSDISRSRPIRRTNSSATGC